MEGDSADCFIKAEYFSGHKSSIESGRFQVNQNDKLNPDFFKQIVKNTKGEYDRIHEEALPIFNEKEEAIAFITPDEKLFIYVNEKGTYGYFEDGIKSNNKSYFSYVEDKYNRKSEPLSWGLYLAARDSGQFVVELVDNPSDTLKGLAKLLKKIVTLNFSIDKIWKNIQKADKTDVSYVMSSILMGYLAGPKGLKAVKAKDMHKFTEIVEDLSQHGSKKLTWPQLKELFKKALLFEAKITEKLLEKFPVAEGFIHVERLYLKVNNVVSIADNCIYNKFTGKWILNETKYGIKNTLRKNQRVIDKAIGEGTLLEIRSVKALENITDLTDIVSQGSYIKIDKILRSHSIDGIVTSNTIKTIWPN